MMQIPSRCNCIVRDHAYNECPFLDWRKVNNPTNRTRNHGNSILSSKERRAIHSFFQGSESFCDAWERFKDLTFEFYHHGLNRWQLLSCFYDGLHDDDKNRIDRACGGSHLDKEDFEVEELIENLANIERKVSRRLENIETSLGKVTDMMQKFMTNSNFSNVRNVPCSLCFSRNHADGQCVENSKDYARRYVSSYNVWQGREYATYNHESQPTIDFQNTFHVNNHASLRLEENYVISSLNEKSSFHPYEISFEDEIEKNEKRNDDSILEDIDPIVPNESLDMIYEDQKSYVDDDFSLNEIVDHSKKDIFIENVLDEFLEDFFTDEEEENVEEFPTNEEEQGEIESFDEIISDIHVVLSDFRIDMLIDKNNNSESQMNRGEEVIMIEDEVRKKERLDVKEEVKVLEVSRRGYLEDKRELLEPTNNCKNLRKIFLADWHDHSIDIKYDLLRFLSNYTLSPCTPTQLTHEVICMTKLKNHRLKRKIKHQRLAAVLPQILYEHIYPIPKVRKIFHIAWHCLPKNLGILYLRLVLHLPDISFKDNNFLDLSIKNSFYKFFIKIFPKPILKYKFIHMGIENLIKEFKIL